MSIDNTQWADYDNREEFDRILATLSGWGFVDSSWGNDCFPSISFLGDGTNYFEIRVWVAHKDPANRVDYGNSTDENTPQFLIQSIWDECKAVSGFVNRYNDTFYEGEDVGRVISVCTKLSPVYRVYSELVGRGYEVISTGGGADIWAKDFGDHTVMAGDSLTGNLAETHEGINGEIVIDAMNAIGFTITDADGFNVDFDSGENFVTARVNGDIPSFNLALDAVEKLATERAMGGKDLLAEMAPVYDQILWKHFKGMTPMSADEFLMEYRDQMTIDQQKLISSFIRFWDDLQSMEG